ncbi:MAG: hypothetical protein HYY84_08715 [Deltaproteobacteria bacterium]|nr:hypothetical protein [Deltaproteobacteria bacterium]
MFFGRSEIPNRFPVDVNSAIAVELLAAGFNLPQALGIIVARETTGPFTGWKDLRQELRRHGLLDCGPYCLRAIEKARPYIVFSGPTRMPVGAGIELVVRARDEWRERGAQIGTALKSVSRWLFENRRFLGRVNVNDASTEALLAVGIGLVEAELVRAVVAGAAKPFANFGEIEIKLRDLERNAPCGRFCRNAFERMRASKLVTFASMTTVVHPDPLRELDEAKEQLKVKLKKMAAADRADLETLSRFARANGLIIPSLVLVNAPTENESQAPSPTRTPDSATPKPKN